MEEDGTVPLAPAPNQAIAGWTNLAPGSTVTVTLSNGAGDPFPVTETVRVTRERPPENEAGARYRFRAEFDLRGATPGTAFDIRVRSDGTQLGPLNSWEEGEGYRGYVEPAPATTVTETATRTPTDAGGSTSPTAVSAVPTSTASPTPTASPVQTPTEGSEPTPTRAVTESPTAETTAADGPGFGRVATLVGLLALAALGVRCSGRRSR